MALLYHALMLGNAFQGINPMKQLEEILLNLFILVIIIFLNTMILFCGLEKIPTQSNCSEIKKVSVLM